MIAHLEPGEFIAISCFVVGCGGFVLDLVTAALLHRSLASVDDRELRLARPAVWLPAIPCVGFLFHFYVLPRVVDSLEAAGGVDPERARRTRRIATWYAIARTANLVPCVDLIAAPTALILLGVFLLKLSEIVHERRSARA